MMAGTVTSTQPIQLVAPWAQNGAGVADTLVGIADAFAGAPDAFLIGAKASSSRSVALSGGVSVASSYRMNEPSCGSVRRRCSVTKAKAQAEQQPGHAQPCAL